MLVSEEVRDRITEVVERHRCRHSEQMATALRSLDPCFEQSAEEPFDLGRYALLAHVFFGVRHASRIGDPNLAAAQLQVWKQRDELLASGGLAWFRAADCRQVADDRYLSPVYLVSDGSEPSTPPLAEAEALYGADPDAAWICAEGVGIAVNVCEVAELGTSNSWAITGLPGTVCTEAPASSVRIAEALVHEGGHNLLNAILAAYKIDLQDEARWYSPWKDCNRPAFGLVHAVWAFSALVRFWDAAAQWPGRSPAEDWYCGMRIEEERQNLVRVRKSFEQCLHLVFDTDVRELLESAYSVAVGTSR